MKILFFVLIFIVSNQILIAESATESLLPIEVTETPESPEFMGFDTSFRELPVSVDSFDQSSINSVQARRLSDLTTLDASITDGYNATGYWDIVSIRGFILDNKSNFFREGLPISAETSIPLENKERVDVLKGIGGIQAGAASPGGVVNYVVKRPTSQKVRTIRLGMAQERSVLVTADAGGRFNEKFGYRFNLARENLRPQIKDAEGDRSLLASAFDWRLSESSSIEAELEWSRKSQPSVPGFSLLGNRLPSPVDPNTNLNDLSWSKPTVFEGLSGSIRFNHALSDDWMASLTAGGQNLVTDDRLAYPYGCSSENNFDRYCSNGDFDLYDYRSENERRNSRGVKLLVSGRKEFEKITHNLSFGTMFSSQEEKMGAQAYNFVGIGNVGGIPELPADPLRTNAGSNRRSNQLEFFAYDRMELGEWSAWLGGRQTNLHRKSELTDKSGKVDYYQNFVLPWAAVSYEFPDILTYLSYGEGLESFVTPNRDGYTEKGQYLRDVRSRQWEVGAKGQGDFSWGLALFTVKRPLVEDLPPVYKVDGEIQQKGLEAELQKQYGYFHFGASYMLVEALRKNSNLRPELNGKKAVNVPVQSFRGVVGYEVPKVQGLSFDLRLVHEGKRAVLPDNSVMLSDWTRWDFGASYVWNKHLFTRLYVENLAAARYWKESPTQYGHVYLFPGMTRNLRLDLQYSF